MLHKFPHKYFTLPSAQHPLSQPYCHHPIQKSHCLYSQAIKTLIPVGKNASIYLDLVQLPSCHKMGKKLWGPTTKTDGFAASLRCLSHRTQWFMAWQHFSNHNSFENKTPANQGGLVSLKYIKKSLPQVVITSVQHFLKGQHQTTLKGFWDAAIPAFCHLHNGPILSVNS